MRGLVWGTVADAIPRLKGRPGRESVSRPQGATAVVRAAVAADASGVAVVELSAPLAQALDAGEGDLVYVSDSRWWLGGLRSQHAVVGGVVPSPDHEMTVTMPPPTYSAVAGDGRQGRAVLVQRQYSAIAARSSGL